ncbi:hypothetical protein DIPPA_26634 [Diplonema papillatum]|nr:hypothetical protein DIPPA_26634 [Diplonema papillatum]
MGPRDECVREALEAQVRVLGRQVDTWRRLAENRADQVAALRSAGAGFDARAKRDGEQQLKAALAELAESTPLHEAAVVIVRLLVASGEAWPKVVDAFRSAVSKQEPLKPAAKRFADGIAEAGNATDTELPPQFYRPAWRPLLDHWGTADEIKSWMDPLGNKLWDAQVVRGMLKDVRLIARHHAFGQPPEVVVPLAIYTEQLSVPDMHVCWMKGDAGKEGHWEVLKESPFEPGEPPTKWARPPRETGGGVRLTARAAAALAAAAPDATVNDLLRVAFAPAPGVWDVPGLRFFRAPEHPAAEELVLASYRNETQGDPSLSPYQDTVLWLPPWPDLDPTLHRTPAVSPTTPNGPFTQDGSPLGAKSPWPPRSVTLRSSRRCGARTRFRIPSGVLEYIFSRNVEERLSSEQFGAAEYDSYWAVQPYGGEDPRVARVLAMIGGRSNPLENSAEVAAAVRDLAETGPPALRKVLRLRLNLGAADGGDVTPQSVANVLQLQELVYDGDSYLLSISPSVSGRGAVCTEDGRWVTSVSRLTRSCDDQIFKLVNHTMRSIQAREMRPVLTLSELGEITGEYAGGGAVDPFHRTTPPHARAQWHAKSGFAVYLNYSDKPAAIVSTAWALQPKGSLIHQIKGLVYYLRKALTQVPESYTDDSPARCYRGLEGTAVPQYKNGAVLLWSAFSSASLDSSTACMFAAEAGAVFSVTSTHGKAIGNWSRYARERELLFAPNTWLRVGNALTSEMKELSGALARSQLFELSTVSQTAVHCARVRGLLPRVRSGAGASVLFHVEESLRNADGIVDLTLPESSIGECPPRWHMLVTLPGDATGACPVRERMEWEPVPGNLTETLAFVAEKAGALEPLPVDAAMELASAKHRLEAAVRAATTFSSRTDTHAPTTTHNIPSDVRGEAGKAVLLAVCRLLGVDEACVTDVSLAPPIGLFDERKGFSLVVRGRSGAPPLTRAWNATAQLRKTGGRQGMAAGMEGAVLIAAALALKVPLKRISLRNNRVPSQGVALLLEAVRENSHVIEIAVDEMRAADDSQPDAQAWSVLRSSLPRLVKANRYKWHNPLAIPAIKLRCLLHREGAVTLRQLLSYGADWLSVAVAAFWDLPDVLDTLPTQALVAHSAAVYDSLVLALAREWSARRAPETPAHLLFGATKLGRVDLVVLLLKEFRFDIDAISDEDHQSVLHYACKQKAFDSPAAVPVLQQLTSARCLKLQSRSNGWTPLHVAVHFYHPEVVSYLLACHADADVPDREGRTPLCLARENRYQSLVEILEPVATQPAGPGYLSVREPRLSRRERSAKSLSSFLQSDELPSNDIVVEHNAAVYLQLKWKRYKARTAAAQLATKGVVTEEDRRRLQTFEQTHDAAFIVANIWSGPQLRKGALLSTRNSSDA